MQKIQKTVAERIGVSPDYLIPVPKEMVPKIAIGKIQRQELRTRFEAGEFNPIWTIGDNFSLKSSLKGG